MENLLYVLTEENERLHENSEINISYSDGVDCIVVNIGRPYDWYVMHKWLVRGVDSHFRIYTSENQCTVLNEQMTHLLNICTAGHHVSVSDVELVDGLHTRSLTVDVIHGTCTFKKKDLYFELPTKSVVDLMIHIKDRYRDKAVYF